MAYRPLTLGKKLQYVQPYFDEIQNTVSDVAFVKVTSPAKVGEGISSYIVYRVNTKVCDHNDIIFKFNGKEFSVLRRFSDFLGLHERLVAKYLSEGVIVPPVPSKDMLGNGLVLFYALQLQLKLKCQRTFLRKMNLLNVAEQLQNGRNFVNNFTDSYHEYSHIQFYILMKMSVSSFGMKESYHVQQTPNYCPVLQR